MNCLYLHIPFCRKKCGYCSFTSVAGPEPLRRRYLAALNREIRRSPGPAPLDTLFVGGGTPTVLAAADLAGLLETCAAVFGFSDRAEISLEANPESVDRESLGVLRRAGFNRISIGVQSFDDAELARLGRIHDGAAAERALDDAGRAGFDNLSLDLMYGIPGQHPASWRHSLERALALEVTHLSAYQLSIEEHTPFQAMAARAELGLPDEAVIDELDEITAELCEGAGLHHYEISNFARPGFECAHNLVYWRNEAYRACGAGAVSFLEGERARRLGDPERYCETIEQGGDPVEEREKLDPEASFRETVVMGLRLVAGLSEERLRRRYRKGLAEIYGETLTGLAARGLVEYHRQRLALTGKGRRFANQVMAELV